MKASILSGAVNVVDTAINYRFQKAERSVGAALRELMSEGELSREDVFIATKNGYLTPDGDLRVDPSEYIMDQLVKPGIISVGDVAQGIHCMTVPYLEDQLQRSLRNLQLDGIDLMYLHNAAESQIPAVGLDSFMQRLGCAFAFYEKQRQAGRIGFYGLATWSCFLTRRGTSDDYLSLEDVVHLAREVGGEDHGFKFIQLPFNLTMPEAFMLQNQPVEGKSYNILDAAKKLGVGVFTSVPLMQGALTRNSNVPRIEGLKTPAQRSLQIIRSAPGAMIAPLVGQKMLNHVRENIEVASVPPLRREEFERMIAVVKFGQHD